MRVEEKMQTLESCVKTLRKALEDKDSLVSKLQLRLDVLEKKNDEEKELFKIKFKNLEKEQNKKVETPLPVKSVNKRKCTKCEFQTVSERGLKVHVKRKHTASIEEAFPQVCDLCDYKVKCKKELKSHRLSHSYIDAKFKCEDCEYVGDNDESMHVHAGKAHSENYECGLCESIFNSLEKLETHLVTCEVYEFNHCYFTSKDISKIKVHVLKEHGSTGELVYMKMARGKFDQVDAKTYSQSEI